jgi:hypothetical protein
MKEMTAYARLPLQKTWFLAYSQYSLASIFNICIDFLKHSHHYFYFSHDVENNLHQRDSYQI